MRYKVFVSNGHDYTSFYCEHKNQADLLFNMAKYSGLFTYVNLSECVDECFQIKEWEGDEQNV